MIDPKTLKNQLPLSKTADTTVSQARQNFSSILTGNDDRLIVIVGPCSIHDKASTLEYGSRLKKLQEKHRDTLHIIMRTYFEKPRTTTGWKGLIYDPDLDQTNQIEKGLFVARDLLLQLNTAGIPTATEILNPLTAPYLSDLISWGVIGARTVESQIHRELASNLPFPVGFKNSTQGNISVAIEAVKTAARSHQFININDRNQISSVKSTGNACCHIVLRGGQQFTNYDKETVVNTQFLLEQHGLIPRLMIDCSHGNSQKNPSEQINVFNQLADRITQGENSIFGVMLESHLVAGKQSISDQKPLIYGKSITDPCIGWSDTETILERLSESMCTRQLSKIL